MSSTAQVFAAATRALVEDGDLHDVLLHVLDDCRRVLDAGAVGVMVQLGDGTLELLAATSHRTRELELYQIQADAGPCPEAIRTGSPVQVVGAAALRERWPAVGGAVVEAGFGSVEAFPVRWHGSVLGGLNVFRGPEQPVTDAAALGQAFADVVSLLLVRRPDESCDDVALRVRQAIAGRAVIEQAKGVLAHQLGLDPGDAFDDLIRIAAEREVTVTAVAQQLLGEAQHAARVPDED